MAEHVEHVSVTPEEQERDEPLPILYHDDEHKELRGSTEEATPLVFCTRELEADERLRNAAHQAARQEDARHPGAL